MSREKDVLVRCAKLCGWSDPAQIAILMNYIENTQRPGRFEEFINAIADADLKLSGESIERIGVEHGHQQV